MKEDQKKRVAKKVISVVEKIDKYIYKVLEFLFDRPLKRQLEKYYEKHHREMSRRQIEEYRFRLFLRYGILLIIIVTSIYLTLGGDFK